MSHKPKLQPEYLRGSESMRETLKGLLILIVAVGTTVAAFVLLAWILFSQGGTR